MVRFLGIDAGPFRLALPLSSVRQILDVGGPQGELEATAREGAVVSLASLLKTTPSSPRPAALLIDGAEVVVTCCGLRGVLDAAEPRPLPRTVACRFPGLWRGTILERDALTLVVDPAVLSGLIEATLPPSR